MVAPQYLLEVKIRKIEIDGEDMRYSPDDPVWQYRRFVSLDSEEVLRFYIGDLTYQLKKEFIKNG